MNSKLGWMGVLVAAGTMAGLTGCGVGANGNQPALSPSNGVSSGSVTGFITDAPVAGVVAFQIDMTGATLTDVQGRRTNLTNTVQGIEVRHLELSPTLAFQGVSAPSGNYVAMNLTFANPQLTLTDARGNVTQLNNTTTPSVRLAHVSLNQPVALNLAANSNAGLMIDFDLHQSLSVDANGNYVIDPIVKLGLPGTQATLSPNLTNAAGTIISIPAAGVFDLQLRDGGQKARITTDSSTQFTGTNGQFSSLQVGQAIEVAARFQSDGTFAATRIEAAFDPSLSLQGVVTSVSHDTEGNASLEVVAQQ
jgi:hypothetical protein